MSFDPYGAATSTTGSVATPLRFDGRYTDDDTGFVNLGARYYDPATGQFISVDPMVLMTASPFGYVAGNPMNGSDQTGLMTDPGPLPGYLRAQKYSAGWPSANLQQVIGDWVGAPCDDDVTITAGTGRGKVIYGNSATNIDVVYDAGRNYFRVQNQQGQYLTDTGTWDANSRLAASHFNNSGQAVTCIEDAWQSWDKVAEAEDSKIESIYVAELQSEIDDDFSGRGFLNDGVAWSVAEDEAIAFEDE